MSEFQTAVDNVIKLEGGYAEPPAVEQPTKYGITQTDWSAWFNQANLIETATPINVRDISVPEAEEYILSQWWQKAPFVQINNQELCNYVFQSCFLSGMETGIKLLQSALLYLQPDLVIAIDGILGDSTLSIVNAANIYAVLVTMRLLTARHYLSIVKVNSAKKEYLQGWMDRALNG